MTSVSNIELCSMIVHLRKVKHKKEYFKDIKLSDLTITHNFLFLFYYEIH